MGVFFTNEAITLLGIWGTSMWLPVRLLFTQRYILRLLPVHSNDYNIHDIVTIQVLRDEVTRHTVGNPI